MLKLLESIFRVSLTCFICVSVLGVGVAITTPNPAAHADYLKQHGYTPELNPCALKNLTLEQIQTSGVCAKR